MIKTPVEIYTQNIDAGFISPYRQMTLGMWAVYLPLPANDTRNVGSLSPPTGK